MGLFWKSVGYARFGVNYWIVATWEFMLSLSLYAMIMLALIMASIGLFYIIRDLAETDNRESAILTFVFVGGIAALIAIWNAVFSTAL